MPVSRFVFAGTHASHGGQEVGPSLGNARPQQPIRFKPGGVLEASMIGLPSATFGLCSSAVHLPCPSVITRNPLTGSEPPQDPLR